jgi:hypothetical protein
MAEMSDPRHAARRPKEHVLVVDGQTRPPIGENQRREIDDVARCRRDCGHQHDQEGEKNGKPHEGVT